MAESETPRPLANLLATVREGSATLRMTPEDFVYVDRDCEYFKVVINKIMVMADGIATQTEWGLGENNEKMVSGRTVAGRFREKANGAGNGNSVWQVMQDHLRIVEDIQEVHRIARERMMQADAEFAAQFNELNETLPDRGPAERTPEQAWEALGRMPGVLGDLYGPASTSTTTSPWPGIPLPGTNQ